MLREQMDGTIGYIYLFQSFPSVLPQLQSGIARQPGGFSLKQAASIFSICLSEKTNSC